MGAPDRDQGVVHVFLRDQNGPGQWGEATQLTAAAGAVSFGVALAIDLDFAVVGSLSGSALVFAHVAGGAATWNEVASLSGTSGDGFGKSIAIDGSRVLVGAPLDDSVGAVLEKLRSATREDNTP